MASIAQWRGRFDAAIVIGAIVGGMLVGAIGNAFGLDGVELLTGAEIEQVTGMAEGGVLGLATGTSVWWASRVREGDWHRPILISALAGALAGLAIHSIGGNMLGGSLAALQADLPGARLDFAKLASMMGEVTFNDTVALVTTMIEGAVFVIFLTAGYLSYNARR